MAAAMSVAKRRREKSEKDNGKMEKLDKAFWTRLGSVQNNFLKLELGWAKSIWPNLWRTDA
ncbi:hypothetical protein E2562_030788 [Oryza meyeriana var. granulata]|uniref:Uncharacterized protein n=1 Tax=Oryza meyeriana var. granulata TaxID=110450 RepID=A0A6G1C9R9_9ORYZ|nr:hypothetical protein E2562_030788 [Oryza meyeriana var. granulata]